MVLRKIMLVMFQNFFWKSRRICGSDSTSSIQNKFPTFEGGGHLLHLRDQRVHLVVQLLGRTAGTLLRTADDLLHRRAQLLGAHQRHGAVRLGRRRRRYLAQFVEHRLEMCVIDDSMSESILDCRM